jgi:hypothetical protein
MMIFTPLTHTNAGSAAKVRSTWNKTDLLRRRLPYRESRDSLYAVQDPRRGNDRRIFGIGNLKSYPARLS